MRALTKDDPEFDDVLADLSKMEILQSNSHDEWVWILGHNQGGTNALPIISVRKYFSFPFPKGEAREGWQLLYKHNSSMKESQYTLNLVLKVS